MPSLSVTIATSQVFKKSFCIDLKNYPERFALCGLPVVKVGINFDTERHTLADWKIESVK